MKLVIDLFTGAVIARTSDAAFAPSAQQALADTPPDFDMETASEWAYDGNALTHDPAIALARTKATRIAAIKTEASALIAATDWRLQRARERETAGWAALADVDVVLSEREAIRRSSNAAELAVAGLTDIAAIRAFAWVVDTFPPEPKRVTHTQMIDLFTEAELTEIRGNPLLANWWTRFTLADFVSLADPSTVAGINALAALGVLAPGRAAQILAGEKPA